MRYTTDEPRRYAFRDWLRSELARLDFYQRRGNRYLVSEFARYAKQLEARVEEVSLGRYLREDDPVLPTPESCRELAKALDRHPAEVLLEAGYLRPEDFFYLPDPGVTAEQLRRQAEEIERASYLPEAVRAQMQASWARQIELTPVHTEAEPVREREPRRVAPPVRGAREAAREAANASIAELPTDILDERPQQHTRRRTREETHGGSRSR